MSTVNHFIYHVPRQGPLVWLRYFFSKSNVLAGFAVHMWLPATIATLVSPPESAEVGAVPCGLGRVSGARPFKKFERATNSSKNRSPDSQGLENMSTTHTWKDQSSVQTGRRFAKFVMSYFAWCALQAQGSSCVVPNHFRSRSSRFGSKDWFRKPQGQPFMY